MSTRSTRFVCPICYRFASFRFKVVLRHLGQVHAHQPNFHVSCGISGCPRTYEKFAAFKKHVYRSHPSECKLYASPNKEVQSQEHYDDNHDTTITEVVTDIVTHDEDVDYSEELTTDTYHETMRQSALLLLKLKQKHKIAQSDWCYSEIFWKF